MLTCPPISSTSFFTIASPRPVPSVLLSVEVRSRSNASKACFWNSSSMPIPVSCTEIRYSENSSFTGVSSYSSVIFPPSGVNFTALFSILTRICCNFVSSHQTQGFCNSLIIWNWMCFFSMLYSIIIFSFSDICFRSTAVSSNVSFPLSILDRSSTSLISFIKTSPDACIFVTAFLTTASSSGCFAMISANPRIAFIGVRMSWDMFARNVAFTAPASFASLAASFSCSNASSNFSRCSLSCSFFWCSTIKRYASSTVAVRQ